MSDVNKIERPSPDDFWDWAFEAYKKEALKMALLRAQSKGADVNLILLTLWCDTHRARIQHLEPLVKTAETLRPALDKMREKRSQLKGTALYEKAKTEELTLEHKAQSHLIATLAKWLPVLPAPPQNFKRYGALIDLPNTLIEEIEIIWQNRAND